MSRDDAYVLDMLRFAREVDNLPGTFLLNYRGFLGSCTLIQLLLLNRVPDGFATFRRA
jgi:hypothetical protein